MQPLASLVWSATCRTFDRVQQAAAAAAGKEKWWRSFSQNQAKKYSYLPTIFLARVRKQKTEQAKKAPRATFFSRQSGATFQGAARLCMYSVSRISFPPSFA
jgi:pSer/pThr/pTyr-binding forkhead associated (FHA) protein